MEFLGASPQLRLPGGPGSARGSVGPRSSGLTRAPTAAGQTHHPLPCALLIPGARVEIFHNLLKAKMPYTR